MVICIYIYVFAEHISAKCICMVNMSMVNIFANLLIAMLYIHAVPRTYIRTKALKGNAKPLPRKSNKAQRWRAICERPKGKGIGNRE